MKRGTSVGNPQKAAGVLRTLAVSTPEEQEILETLLGCAQRASQGIRSEVHQLVSDLPGDAQRHFHGLVEALEIYQSLHGPCSTPRELKLREVKQIRDLCLSEGLRSIY